MNNEKLSAQTIGKIKRKINPTLIKRNAHAAYGTGEYLEVETFIDLMNEIFDYHWSWELLEKEVIYKGDTGFEALKNPFVQVKGRLTVPGIGVKEAYGAQPLVDGKNMSQAAKAASAYAFKMACKMCGVGNFEEPEELFDEIVEEEEYIEEEVPIPAKPKFSPESLLRMKEFKEIFEIDDNKQLIPFIRAWSKNTLSQVTDITPSNIDKFLDWTENEASEVAEDSKKW